MGAEATDQSEQNTPNLSTYGAFVTEDQTANQGMNQLPLSASTASFGSKKSDIPTGHDHGSHIVQT